MMIVLLILLLVVLLTVTSCGEKGGKSTFSDFLWGVSISGFQADMGPNSPPDRNSDWWIWTHDERNIAKGYVRGFPEDGPDFWTHYEKDIDLADGLGVNAFRYGVEWSRVFPRSTTGIKVKVRYVLDYPIIVLDEELFVELERAADQESVRKYRMILEHMRKRGLRIFLTLNHFSLPLWLHDPVACRDWFEGVGMEELPDGVCFGRPSGWLSPDILVEFGKYVAFVARKFGDLVDMWGPINEPIVVAMNGYLLGGVSGLLGFGAFPPAASNRLAFEIVLKNLILAHAVAYDIIHQADRYDADGDGRPAEVCLVYNVSHIDGDDDRAVQSAWDVLVWRYIDAVLFGKVGLRYRPELHRKADIIGVNYYNRFQVFYVPVIPSVGIFFLPKSCPPSGPSDLCPYGISEMGYEIYPPGLYHVLVRVWERYRSLGIPILVTENGVADSRDEIRGWFIREHLKYLRKALGDGVPVIGYFYWSLLDNLEWSLGYEKKFGLVEVDFSSPARTRKLRKSASVFSEEIKGW